MSAYSTRSITESRAKGELTAYYAQMIAKVQTMSGEELETQMNQHISDNEEYLLINFTVLPDYDYMYADIS